MCVIAISGRGARQPSVAELRAMFYHNPHGAGYMLATGGGVRIEKGFMRFDELMDALCSECFTKDDPVVYHFRISTQAGVNPEMTQPFPLTTRLDVMEQIETDCAVGIAHNGIIPLTSDRSEPRYSDTALFIAHYLYDIMSSLPGRVIDGKTADYIQSLIGWSKLAIMDGTGHITTIGEFTEDRGILLSNTHHKMPRFTWRGGKP